MPAHSDRGGSVCLNSCRAVDDAGGRARLPTFSFVRRHDEFIVDDAQQSFVASAPEIFLHRRERREAHRRQPPSPARRSHVEQRVHELAQVRLPGSADAVRRRRQWLDQRSLGVRQAACVALAAPFMAGASGFGPGHRDLRRISAIRLNNNPLKSLIPFWSGHSEDRANPHRVQRCRCMRCSRSNHPSSAAIHTSASAMTQSATRPDRP